MRYRIVSGSTIESLEREVGRLLDKGWLPQGGVCQSVWVSEDDRKGYSEIGRQQSREARKYLFF